MSEKAYREIDEAELDGLIERVQTAVEHELSLSLDDMRLLLAVLFSFAHLHERLSENAITVHKLRKLAGIVSASEKLRDVLPEAAKAKVSKPRTKKARAPKPSPEELIHERCTHSLEGLGKGDRCPECERGTLYKYAPASFIRLSGQSPLRRTQHLLERLRCNLCGAYFTADLDETVREDGEPSQQYGYSARAIIAIHKYFGGQPLYRQYTLGQLLGVSLSASSGFDQCERVANAGQAVMRCLIAQAANAVHYYLDDTKNRILNQHTVEKPDRRSGKLKTRSGVYTSGVIATLAEGHQAVLFQTTIGHAGEWIDEILAPRSSQAPPPILMSDALSHNRPSVIKTYELSLCNAHGRREFVNLAEHAPDQIAWVVQEYGKIWDHETHCREGQLSGVERLAYHREKSLPVMEAIKAWADKQLNSGAVESNSALGKQWRIIGVTIMA